MSEKKPNTLFAQIYEHFGFSPGGRHVVNQHGVKVLYLPRRNFNTPEMLALFETFRQRTDLITVELVELEDE